MHRDASDTIEVILCIYCINFIICTFIDKLVLFLLFVDLSLSYKNLQYGFEKLCPLFNKMPFSLDFDKKNTAVTFKNYFAICCHFHQMTHEIVEMPYTV